MPGKSKKGGGLEVSAYKMKYQGNHSAFPFKSPLKDKEIEKEESTVVDDDTTEKENIKSIEEDKIGGVFGEEEITIEQIKPF